jgi:uncharacterized protein YjbI with pentapeptide repeats
VTSDYDTALNAIETLARMAGGEAAPNLDGAVLTPDVLRDRVAAAHPAWWDEVRGGVKLVRVDLRGASLRDADLSGANISGSDLSGIQGRAVRLRDAHLEEARFDGADMAGADLSGARAGEASFEQAMLEDASLERAGLRYATLRGAVLDGANLESADLWGACLDGVEASRVILRGARLDEASLAGADLSNAHLENASLKRADLHGARLKGANLRGADLDGANLDGADLAGARLPLVVLRGCNLRHVRLAGAWLERTQMQVQQLGGAIGEEIAGEFGAARDGYTVLEQNFSSLGDVEAASWAFRKRRRMGKRDARCQAQIAWRERRWSTAYGHGTAWLSDVFVEWLCDYGENLPRVARAFAIVLVGYALFYWATGGLVSKGESPHGSVNTFAQLLQYSLGNMTTVGIGDLDLHPANEVIAFAATSQSLVGPVLLGLFGYVLGNKLRR